MRKPDLNRIIILVLSMTVCWSLKAQEFYTASRTSDIRSLQVLADGDFRKMPVIGIDDHSVITVSFDYISDQQPWIDYTVVHCDRYWQRDDLDESEYLDYSYLPQHIEEVKPSFNTFLQYYHYKVTIPNQEVRPSVSGNYALLFHPQGEPDSILAVATFCVSEKMAFIGGEVSGNTDIDFNAQHQQLSLEVGWGQSQLPNLNPATEMTVRIQQNGRRDNEQLVSKPLRIEANRVVYEYDRQLIFEGGNNWHRFEFTDEKYPGIGVDRIRFQSSLYHAFLNLDQERSLNHYIYDQDQHGRFYLHALRVEDKEVESEYFKAVFTLKASRQLDKRGVYLLGEFTHQALDSLSRMEYDDEEGVYRKEVLLKQGAYNYMYVVPEGTQLSTAAIEGNHYETPNEYQIYVYYHPFAARYDRLIGIGVLNAHSQASTR